MVGLEGRKLSADSTGGAREGAQIIRVAGPTGNRGWGSCQ
jgi:hypothetical protein